VKSEKKRGSARAVMILGTHSSAGKSVMASAFCRILARKGIRVAPFKAQNMSNNAGVTPEGGEMGRAQIVQAEAARVTPHTDMNPVLLKPEGDRRSQIILNGKAFGHIDAVNWLDLKAMLWDEVRAAYDRLAARFDVVVMEGAGSPAEINLKSGDIVNLRMAKHADAPCLLVGDIDRGGVFAALAGTMHLLDPDEREMIRGFIINRFRGDPNLLGDGPKMLEERAFDVPVLGVVPFLHDLWVADEDAVCLERVGDGSRVPAGEFDVDIAILYLSRISNLDEFDALAAEPGVRVRFVRWPNEVGEPNALIIPGTKATLADLAWLKRQGLDQAILRAAALGSEVVGVCGGYQILGNRLFDPDNVEGGGDAHGLGLLPVETTFEPDKRTDRVLVDVGGERLSGYEIHTGRTDVEGGAGWGCVLERNGKLATGTAGACNSDGNVWGTYLHDVFANDGFRHAWLRKLGWKGSGESMTALRDKAFEELADAVEEALDWDRVEAIVGL